MALGRRPQGLTTALVPAVLSILCLAYAFGVNHQDQAECIYAVSPAYAGIVIRGLDHKSYHNVSLPPVDPEGAPGNTVSWGIDSHRGLVYVSATSQGLTLVFDPLGDPTRFSSNLSRGWLDTDVPLVHDKRLTLAFRGQQAVRPMCVDWPESGDYYVQGIGRGLKTSDQDTSLMLFPNSAKSTVYTNSTTPALYAVGTSLMPQAIVTSPVPVLPPVTSVKFIDNNHVLATNPFAPGVYQVDIRTGEATLFYLPTGLTHWDIAVVRSRQRVYLSCTLLHPCVDILDLNGNLITAFRDVGVAAGQAGRGMAVYGDRIFLSFEGIGVREYKMIGDIITFVETLIHGDIADITIAPCPRVDVPPATKKAPIFWIVFGAVLFVVVSLLLGLLLWRSHLKSKNDPERKRIKDASKFVEQLHKADIAKFQLEKEQLDFSSLSSTSGSNFTMGTEHMDSTAGVPSIRPASSRNSGRSNSTRVGVQSLAESLPTRQGSTDNVPSSLDVAQNNSQISAMSSSQGIRARRLQLLSVDSSGSRKEAKKMTGGCVQIPSEQVKLTRLIGSGAFAHVYHGTWNGIEVAVKINREVPDKASRHKFQEEVELFCKLRHPNVCHMLGCIDLDRAAIVMEYKSRGCLYDYLEYFRETDIEPRFPDDMTYQIALDVAVGLLYLHSRPKPVIHRDIKSLNVLLDANFRASIADFGLSKELALACPTGSMTACIGTPAWMAPELVGDGGRRTHYTEAIDVFAYGMVLHELLTLQEPRGGLAVPDVMRRLIREPDRRPPIPEGSPPLWVKLMEECWATNPHDRPTMVHVVDYLLENEKDMKARANFPFIRPTPSPVPALNKSNSTGKTNSVFMSEEVTGTDAEPDSSTRGSEPDTTGQE